MVFNGGEIVHRGDFMHYAFFVITTLSVYFVSIEIFSGRFCDLPDLGGNFSFQSGDFCRLEYTQILNLFQYKNYICNFGTKLFDAVSTLCSVTKVIKRNRACDAQ